MSKLSPDMFDAITEVINIGVGYAARSMREMIGEAVEVTLPHVDIVDQSVVEEEFGGAAEDSLLGTSTTFEGGFGGEAMLLLEKQAASNLAESMLKDSIFDANSISQQDVIEEIGNVLITACFTKIADILQVRLSSTPPTYLTGVSDIRDLFSNQMSDDIIWFRFRFSVHSIEVSGYIYFLMDPMHTFLNAVRRLVEVTMAPPPAEDKSPS